jgi:hypothetical protein
VAKGSAYWEFLRLPNNDDFWDMNLKTEGFLLEQLGQIFKEIVMSNGPSLSMRMEVESSYIDYKYYLDTLINFADEVETKTRLINCLLLHRHYILAMEKKTVDSQDYV